MQIKRIAVELKDKLKVTEAERDEAKVIAEKPPIKKLLGSLKSVIERVEELRGSMAGVDQSESVQLKKQLQLEYTPRVKVALQHKLLKNQSKYQVNSKRLRANVRGLLPLGDLVLDDAYFEGLEFKPVTTMEQFEGKCAELLAAL